MLKEGEETLFIHALPPTRAERLKIIKDGCYRVLVDLQGLVKRYESLGTQSKRTWDRMRWGNEDIAEIRARITSNITILTAFISTSQSSVETKLDKFIEEFHQGKKETSVVSLQTVDSLSANDRFVWRTIRKELEDIGISVAAFEANRKFIFKWFIRAVETGAFEEENEDSNDDESSLSAERESQSSGDQDSQDMERQVEHSRHEPLGNINKYQRPVRTQPSRSAPDTERIVTKRDPKNSEQIFAPKRTAPRDRKRVSLAAALLADISLRRQPLIKAVTARDVPKALKILRDEASFQLLDSRTLNKALWEACRRIRYSNLSPLIAELILKGSDVNDIVEKDYGRDSYLENQILWKCVESGSINAVRLLVENGADLNSNRRIWGAEIALRAAFKGKGDILRLLLSTGVDVNMQYETALLFDPHPTSLVRVTLLQEAAMLGAAPAVAILLEHGASIDIVCNPYGTALMLALARRKIYIAQLLLDGGADPNLNLGGFKGNLGGFKGTKSSSPMEAAILGGEGDASLLRILLDHGAIPNKSTLNYSKAVARLRNRNHEAVDREIRPYLHTSD